MSLHDELQHLIQLVIPSKLIHNEKKKNRTLANQGYITEY